MEVPFAGVDSGKEELTAILRVIESGWLAAGPEVQAFEEEFAAFTDAEYAVCVNSGSSGLLLALNSLKLPPHSKVLTSACGFSSTLTPILHCGFTPVFVDYELRSHNINVAQAIVAIAKDADIRAVVVAHTLGNPIEIAPLADVCHQRGIFLIEDCCEAVGATYHSYSVGYVGDIGVFSFYPSHQMTALGGGGMVITNNEILCTRMRSMRDWGKRYANSAYLMREVKTQYDTLIVGERQPYYWGYVYDEVGFNMKLPDANAAYGRVQLKKLPGWVVQRQRHFTQLQQFSTQWSDNWIPIASPPQSSPSWFGFPITFRHPDPLRRNDFGNYLETAGIRHRPFFAGNLLRQPAFRGLDDPKKYPVADHFMNGSLFVGVWHKLTEEQISYVEETITRWITE